MIRRAGLFGGTLGVALVASSSWPIVQGALAKDHGVMGQTWAIAEPDLLATIDTRLAMNTEAERHHALGHREERLRRARQRATEPDNRPRATPRTLARHHGQ